MVNTSFTDAREFSRAAKTLTGLRSVFANLWGAYVAQRQHQALAQLSERTITRLGLSRIELARQAMSLTTR